MEAPARGRRAAALDDLLGLLLRLLNEIYLVRLRRDLHDPGLQQIRAVLVDGQHARSGAEADKLDCVADADGTRRLRAGLRRVVMPGKAVLCLVEPAAQLGLLRVRALHVRVFPQLLAQLLQLVWRPRSRCGGHRR